MTITESETLIRANLPGQILDNLELCELSRRQAEEAIECGDDQLGKWVRGKYLPSLSAALALSRTLGITLDRLCTGED